MNINVIRHGFLCLLLALSGLAGESFRPPAVPLVAHDPYFSIWSPADRLAEADTVHWTGKPHRLTSLVRIDGKAFRLLGKEPAGLPALPQTGVEVLPTRTICAFAGAGVRLTLTFMTPALPEELDILSRPVTYLTYTVAATDGVSHRVSFYLEAAAELTVNEPRQLVAWSKESTARLEVLKIGSHDQPVLAKRGDDLRIDWGHLYLAAPRAASYWLPGPVARDAFAADAKYPLMKMALPQAAEEAPAAVLVMEAARVTAQPVSRWLMIAYDDGFSLRYFQAKLRPYWRRQGEEAAALLKKAAADYEALAERCAAFDQRLMAELQRVGGVKYAQLCALAYRQTLAGNKLAADAQGQPLLFPKENFSNGCIGTVDVLFPQAPFFLLFSPALTKAMLVPILDYAASPRWPYGYAPHDLGTYPHATGQVYGMGGKDGDRMPVEESGNMLILLAALARQEGNAGFVQPYWPMLTQWADYLVSEGLDPQNQLCSADMFGHLPHSANLALKAIIGIGGYARLCELGGRPAEARKYLAIARDYAGQWQEMARDEGRTRLAYHLPGTWGMKHNLIWDRVLGLDLFPDSVGEAEIAWYLKVQKKYGLPVDNRTETSLLDWALWSIAPARRPADFQALLEPLWRYAHETPSRVPLSDWFVTSDGKMKGFQARPVVGGLFIKLLEDPLAGKQWASLGANTRGPWAPLPVAGTMREVVPTAPNSPVKWRYSLTPPAADWARPGYDDSAWPQGPAGFGTRGTPGAVIGTEWRTKQLWLRHEFKLPDRPLKNPRLVLIYDENPEVFLNGVPAAKLTGWSTAYAEADLSPAALATLKPGKNLLAVRVSQTYGGQCVDVGLVEDGEPLVASPQRWSPERAAQWYAHQPWPCGFNYIPASCISYTEMWMDYAFDPQLIDRELALAQGIGFNCLRVVLSYVVWEAQPEGFKQRFAAFLSLAEKRGLRVMPCFFDDCVFGPISDPAFGRQPEVVAGWYANGWTPSPGHRRARDPQARPGLERFVKDVLTAHRNDPRILCWDLYNEPGNSGMGDATLPLLTDVFRWAREVNPVQPLTSGIWGGSPQIASFLKVQSDILTFHSYRPAAELRQEIMGLQKYGRPLICTEWLNRPHGSTVTDCLPVLAGRQVGALHWGLVNGRTQTHLPWGHKPGDAAPKTWQHDLFRPDHTAYEPLELERFREAIRAADRSAR